MRISDWSSDVCSSDLYLGQRRPFAAQPNHLARRRRDRLQFGKLLRRRDEIGGRHVPRRHPRLQGGMALDDRVDLAFGDADHQPIERNRVSARAAASLPSALALFHGTPLRRLTDRIAFAPHFAPSPKPLRGAPVATISAARLCSRSSRNPRIAMANIASSSTAITASSRLSTASSATSIANRSIPAAQPTAAVGGPPSASISPS